MIESEAWVPHIGGRFFTTWTTRETPIYWQVVPKWASQMGFTDSSVSKESACNAGDPSSIPGSGGSAGEGIGYPFQYSWAFLGSAGCKDSINCKWEVHAFLVFYSGMWHSTVIRKTINDYIYKKVSEQLGSESSLIIRSAHLCRQGCNEANWIFHQFPKGMNSTFTVGETIQVLIWGRMTPCREAG